MSKEVEDGKWLVMVIGSFSMVCKLLVKYQVYKVAKTT
jgi:hypothetical protein